MAPPLLDEFQQSVVDHPGGPLLVLAGPGTGKTTTLVEAIVDRVERRGARPESLLALTFSRKAAEQLRDRVTARLGRTMATTLSSTFHSFAYGLVRRYSTPELYAAPLRLLSAPEQDVVLTELLTDAPESVVWPDSLRQAVGTRGFAREVHAVLGRAREKGLGPDQLLGLGRAEDRADLVAAGLFMQQYLDNLDNQSAVDYAELIVRAGVLARRHRDELRAEFQHVFVDEYQDTDPAQVDLLRAVAGDGRNLIVVGDPDQSIYAFRGAEVRGILDFPRDFATADGARAPVVALRTTRRFGPRLLRASRSIASSIGVRGAIETATFEAFRTPTPAPNPYGDGRVDVLLVDTDRAETEHIADVLRRAHLEDGIPWSQMAVLVRSGRVSIPGLRRSLTVAGVPVEVASDDTPLVQEPAVLPLLDAVRAVVHAHIEDPAHSDYLGFDRVEGLLLSPLGGLDATEVRALARSLRQRDKSDAVEADRSPLSSPELLRRAVLHPETLDGAPGRAAVKVLALGGLLQAARTDLDAGATAEEVLWRLWDGTSWPRRLRSVIDSGGPGSRLAHRDLDAICALFEVAAKAEEQRGHTSVQSFLASLVAQQIPADTLADRGVRGEAVRLLTAHRSKGLEWRLVVVAHVQEEAWPDLRRRSTLLQADRIASDGLLPPTTTASLLAEERRLFYVACTRAGQRLVVTAVQSPEDDGEQPSRFVRELGASPVVLQGRPRRPLSLTGLVAELRRAVADPVSSPELREAAARRLATLASAEARGHPLVPQADPASWWGTRAPSRSERPLRPADEPVRLSASSLDALLTCPAQWFLEREAGGQEIATQSQGFGLVVHALADRIAKGDLTGVDDLMPHVDRVWGQMTFRTPWSGSKERAEVEAALRRFVAWHHRAGARTVVGTEEHLTAEITLPDGQVVVLNGYADRLELDENGRVVVVDLKTGKYKPTKAQVDAHAQLGVYQLAVDHGAADHLLEERVEGPVRSGGAELWQLRLDAVGGGLGPYVQPQHPQLPGDDGVTLVEEQLMQAAATIRSERLVARPGEHCKDCAFRAICPVQGAGTVLS
jgi:superfamily I DNA/RNA helicase/RecB family exonuclease